MTISNQKYLGVNSERNFPFKHKKILDVLDLYIVVPSGTRQVFISGILPSKIEFSVVDSIGNTFAYAECPIGHYRGIVGRPGSIFRKFNDIFNFPTPIGYIIAGSELKFSQEFSSADTCLLESVFVSDNFSGVKRVFIQKLDGTLIEVPVDFSFVAGENVEIVKQNGKIIISAINVPIIENYLKGLQVGSERTSANTISIFGQDIIRIFGEEFSTAISNPQLNCPVVLDPASRGDQGPNGGQGPPGLNGASHTIQCCAEFDKAACTCADDCFSQTPACGEFDSLCCIPNFGATSQGEIECCCPQTEVCCLPLLDACFEENFPISDLVVTEELQIGACPLDIDFEGDAEIVFPPGGGGQQLCIADSTTFDANINLVGVVDITKFEPVQATPTGEANYFSTYYDSVENELFFTLDLGANVVPAGDYIVEVQGMTDSDLDTLDFYCILTQSLTVASSFIKVFCPNNRSDNVYKYYCQEKAGLAQNLCFYSTWIPEVGPLTKELRVQYATGSNKGVTEPLQYRIRLWNISTKQVSNVVNLNINLDSGPFVETSINRNDFTNQNYYLKGEHFALRCLSACSYLEMLDENKTNVVPTSLAEGFIPNIVLVGGNQSRVYAEMQTTLFNRPLNEQPPASVTNSWSILDTASISENGTRGNGNFRRTIIEIQKDHYYEHDNVFVTVTERLGANNIVRIHRCQFTDRGNRCSNFFDISNRVHIQRRYLDPPEIQSSNIITVSSDFAAPEYEPLYVLPDQVNDIRKANTYAVMLSLSQSIAFTNSSNTNWEMIVWESTEEQTNVVSKANRVYEHTPSRVNRLAIEDGVTTTGFFTWDARAEDSDQGEIAHLVGGEIPGAPFPGEEAKYSEPAIFTRFFNGDEVAFHDDFSRFPGGYANRIGGNSRIVRLVYRANASGQVLGFPAFSATQQTLEAWCPDTTAYDSFGWKLNYKNTGIQRIIFGQYTDDTMSIGYCRIISNPYDTSIADYTNARDFIRCTFPDDYVFTIDNITQTTVETFTGGVFETIDTLLEANQHIINLALNVGTFGNLPAPNTAGDQFGGPITMEETANYQTGALGSFTNECELQTGAAGEFDNAIATRAEKISWGYGQSDSINVLPDSPALATEPTFIPGFESDATNLTGILKYQYLSLMTLDQPDPGTLEFYDSYDEGTETFGVLQGSVSGDFLGQVDSLNVLGLAAQAYTVNQPCYNSLNKLNPFTTFHPYNDPELLFPKIAPDSLGAPNIQINSHKRWEMTSLMGYYFNSVTNSGWDPYAGGADWEIDTLTMDEIFFDPSFDENFMDWQFSINDEADEWYVLIFKDGTSPNPTPPQDVLPGSINLGTNFEDAVAAEHGSSYLSTHHLVGICTNVTRVDTFTTMPDNFFPIGHNKIGFLRATDDVINDWIGYDPIAEDWTKKYTEAQGLNTAATLVPYNSFNEVMILERWGSTSRVSDQCRGLDAKEGSYPNFPFGTNLMRIFDDLPEPSPFGPQLEEANSSPLNLTQPVYGELVGIGGTNKTKRVAAGQYNTYDEGGSGPDVSIIVASFDGGGAPTSWRGIGTDLSTVDTYDGTINTSNPFGVYPVTPPPGAHVGFTHNAVSMPPATITVNLITTGGVDPDFPFTFDLPLEPFSHDSEGFYLYQSLSPIGAPEVRNMSGIHLAILKMTALDGDAWELRGSLYDTWSRVVAVPERRTFSLSTSTSNETGDPTGIILTGNLIDVDGFTIVNTLQATIS